MFPFLCVTHKIILHWFYVDGLYVIEFLNWDKAKGFQGFWETMLSEAVVVLNWMLCNASSASTEYWLSSTMNTVSTVSALALSCAEQLDTLCHFITSVLSFWDKTGETTDQVLCPFFNWIVWGFFCVSFISSLYILDIIPLSDYWWIFSLIYDCLLWQGE